MLMAWGAAMWWLCALLVLPTAAPALPTWGNAAGYGIDGGTYRSDLVYSMLRPGRLRALYAFDGHTNSTAAGAGDSVLVDGMTAEVVGGGRFTNVAVEGMAYYMPGGETYIEVTISKCRRRPPVVPHPFPRSVATMTTWPLADDPHAQATTLLPPSPPLCRLPSTCHQPRTLIFRWYALLSPLPLPLPPSP